MDTQQDRDDAYLRNLDQLNALIDYVRMAGLNALNEYQKDKVLSLTTRQGMLITKVDRLAKLHGCGATISTLAREMRMSVSATSHLVDTLEELNLLQRSSDTEDRRSVRISLSAAGRQCADTARRGMLKAIHQLTAELTEEEHDRRTRMINKIYHRAYPQEG